MIFDLVELTLRYHSYYLAEKYKFDKDVALEKIENLENIINIRFKESSVGYKVVNCNIIRIDSEATFNEIIKPAINL